MAWSSGFSIPLSKRAFRNANFRTLRLSLLLRSRAEESVTVPSVRVPVLSVHKTSMLPKFSKASRRRTITPSLAMARAPAESVTVTIAGSNSGVMPTASATAKSNDSTMGRPINWLTMSTKKTMTIITLINRYPNCRTPRANSVSGSVPPIDFATSPSAVCEPVATIKMFATPLRTEVPEKTELVRWLIAASAAMIPGFFSTGIDSPVSEPSLTRKSVAVSMTPSAGTKFPADNWITSPFTISAAGTVIAFPSRKTLVFKASLCLSAASAVDALYSWVKPSSELATTMNIIMLASVHCLRTSESTAPKMRTKSSGLSY